MEEQVKGRHQRRSAEEWAEVVARFEKSGETPKEFCCKEGVTEWSLMKWRRRREKRGTFVEVKGLAPVRGYEAELVFPSGLVLRIGR